MERHRRFNSWRFIVGRRVVLGYEHDRGKWGWDIRVIRGPRIITISRRKWSFSVTWYANRT